MNNILEVLSSHSLNTFAKYNLFSQNCFKNTNKEAIQVFRVSYLEGVTPLERIFCLFDLNSLVKCCLQVQGHSVCKLNCSLITPRLTFYENAFLVFSNAFLFFVSLIENYIPHTFKVFIVFHTYFIKLEKTIRNIFFTFWIKA